MHHRNLWLLGLVVLVRSFGYGQQTQSSSSDVKIRYARSRTFDLTHVRLDVYFDMKTDSVSGTSTLTFKPLMDRLKEFILDAADMTIKKVTSSGTNLLFRQTGDQLIIQLDPGADRDQTVTVAISYETDPTARRARPTGGFGGSNGVKFVHPDPEDPNRKAQVWTQGEPETNRFWFPCYDYPNDKATSEVIIRVPPGWLAISNGKRLGVRSDPETGEKYFHWKQELPHSTYLISVVAGELEQLDDVWEGIPLLYVVPAGNRTKIPNAFANTKEMLTFFSRVTGVKYPWAKYAQSAMTDFGGGMENISATTVGDGVLHDDRAHLDINNDGLNSHEMAHQWFGDLVTCKDWSHIWINEGFASFCGDLWARESDGEDEYRWELANSASSAVGADSRQKRAIVHNVYGQDPMQSMFGSFAYSKPSFILHMLETELGREAFWLGVNRFLKQFWCKCADTHDFQRAMEEATGRDLEAWFQQWFYSPGHPDFKVRWEWNESASTARVSVEQTQKLEGGVPVYHVPVVISFLLGRDFKDFSVECDRTQQEFIFPLPSRPTLVLFDKNRDVLKTLDFQRPLDEEIERLMRAPNSVDRFEAAQKVATQIEKQRAKDALLNAFRTERYYRIRGEIAKTLARLATPETTNLLLATLQSNKRDNASSEKGSDRSGSRLRRVIVEALGTIKNRTDVQTALKQIIENDESYYVRAAAINSLAQLDAKGNWDLFLRAAAQESHNDVVRSAAFTALRSADSDRASFVLMEYLDRSKPMLTRLSAVNALSAVGQGKAEVRERLVSLLASKSPALKRSVIRALQARKEREAAPALEQYLAKETDPSLKQLATSAQQALAGTPPDVAQLQEEIKKLREDNERLQKELAEAKSRVGR